MQQIHFKLQGLEQRIASFEGELEQLDMMLVRHSSIGADSSTHLQRRESVLRALAILQVERAHLLESSQSVAGRDGVVADLAAKAHEQR